MTRSRGFTLVELLVAVLVTAIIAAIGYGAIDQALRNREGLAQRQQRLLAVQGAMRLLLQDFAQLAPRPVRQPGVDAHEPALLADGRGPGLVTLTRGGWGNPAGVQRGTLQRVRYTLDGTRLRREYWQAPDVMLGATPRSRELLDGVRSVRFRYMDESRQWIDAWPPPPRGPAPTAREQRARPLAVEVTLELEDWGTLVRIIEVAG